MYETDPDVKRVVDVAKGLEGLKRSDGIHAAAVVITKDPLTDYLPDPAQARGRASIPRTRRSSPSSRCTASRNSAC